MSQTPGSAQRPLSPHLQIYRPMLTMTMSIVHRITGCALYFGTFLLVAFLVATAISPRAYETASWLAGSIVGKLVMFGYTWALIHHMLGGIRHFIWDTGAGFGAVARERLAQFTIGGSVVLTIVLWAAILLVK
ncbi:succinate dehydrogenase, cytochrome b556 subunit [Ancylobacter sp. 6x-1]|uniref:Succinate dehydrogenase cytochrome b556 subunit n=1 Tax=Ancylobacter crimeensis TaxID=2579147 RepID=A0ABT0DDN1_9HYPH|nr:succinate dehydrogenase, cytochrome b556 subunit [Ancylobacter crimeensis]MCK0198075.1 succinate dehydrogenase, cytochrome b556 subunit [Ancylobacter crimeensis]